jgi:allantoin racemase
MKILWINPVGTASFDLPIGQILKSSSTRATQIDVVSFPHDRPKHLEYHAYEGLITSDIVRITYELSREYDGIVIGCFYDVGLREAREVSRRAVVVAPCQASLVFASHLGNSFSVLVGRRKWMSKMRENVHVYGFGESMVSMRALELGVHDFQEVIILGCTIEFGFHERMQEELQVPVIDAVLAPFKLAEMLASTADKFGWYPSRRWGSEPPPNDEVESWGLFKEGVSYNYVKMGEIE